MQSIVQTTLQGIEAARKRNASTSSASTTYADNSPLKVCGLDNFHCETCGDTGYILVKGEDGCLYARVCDCMEVRNTLRALHTSGLGELAQRYTMEAYRADTPYRRKVRETAQRFVEAEEGWFFIAGQSGSGKTHICTAICLELLKKRKGHLFLPWSEISTHLKTGVTERESYEAELKRYKTVSVLHIDDFLKGSVSEADLRLAFDLLNARYNRPSLRTVISSERSLSEILALDEAIGGRICERAAGFLVKAPAENYRLHIGRS